MGGVRLTVVIVVGTRPEAIKLVPLILAMRHSRTLTQVVVSSGQHHEMVQEVLVKIGDQRIERYRSSSQRDTCIRYSSHSWRLIST